MEGSDVRPAKMMGSGRECERFKEEWDKARARVLKAIESGSVRPKRDGLSGRRFS